jgi:hypothetical protein
MQQSRHLLQMPTDQASYLCRVKPRIPLSNFGGKNCNALIKKDRQINLILLATPLSGRLCERTHMRVRVLFTRAISNDKMLIGFKRNHQKIAHLSMYRTAFYRIGDPVKGIIR